MIGLGILLLVCLPILLCGLIPAWMLGPVGPGLSRMKAAWATAVVLNLLASVQTLGYGYMLSPLAGFGIAASVGGIAGRRAFLYGLLSSFWFIIPIHIHWILTASPDQIAAYGRVPPELIRLTLPGGVLGGLAASGILRLSPSRSRPVDRPVDSD